MEKLEPWTRAILRNSSKGGGGVWTYRTLNSLSCLTCSFWLGLISSYCSPLSSSLLYSNNYRLYSETDFVKVIKCYLNVYGVYTPFFNPDLEGSPCSVPWNPFLWAPLLGTVSTDSPCSLMSFWSTELQNRGQSSFMPFLANTALKWWQTHEVTCCHHRNVSVLGSSSSYP